MLQNSSLYRFNPDGSVLAEPPIPQQEVEIGENPTDLVKRIKNDDPDSMSRAQIAAIVRSGQLTESELRKYVTTYQEKLARPFACFVFILIAVPFGLRAMRSGGSSTSLGFGLSLAIVFVYYIVMTVCSFFGEAFLAWRGCGRGCRTSSSRRSASIAVAASGARLKCGRQVRVNFVEFVRGIGNVLFVMLIAGGVAYVGDRVGHQVGRKRLSLFGMRPRYTSTIIAIATGMVIALVVTLVAIFASEQVKTAFFKLNSLNQQITELTRRERDLEKKVNTGRLVVQVDALMVPFYRIIRSERVASAAAGDDPIVLLRRRKVRKRQLSAARSQTVRHSARRRQEACGARPIS